MTLLAASMGVGRLSVGPNGTRGMNMIKVIRGVVGTATMFALLFSAPVALAATAPSPAALSESVKAELRASMDELEISQPVQEVLILKIASGETLDSDSPTAKPVSVTRSSAGSFVTITSRYGDGSASRSEVEVPVAISPGSVTPLSVTGCTSTIGSGYANRSNCFVEHRTVSVLANSRANYTLVQGGYDQITKAWDWGLQVIGGTYSNVSLKISQAKESSGGPAYATLLFDQTMTLDLAKRRVWMRLYVGGDSAWTGMSTKL